MKIKKGDKVKVLAGKNKGIIAEVIETFKNTGKVLIEGVNTRVHHIKPKKEGEKGQKVVKPAPIQVSNVAIVDAGGVISRVGYKKVDGKKVRIAKKSGETLK
jgi:large subunit ribosomal protein L24